MSLYKTNIQNKNNKVTEKKDEFNQTVWPHEITKVTLLKIKAVTEASSADILKKVPSDIFCQNLSVECSIFDKLSLRYNRLHYSLDY